MNYKFIADTYRENTILIKGRASQPTRVCPLQQYFDSIPMLDFKSSEQTLQIQYGSDFGIFKNILPHRLTPATESQLNTIGLHQNQIFPFSMKQVINNRWLFNLHYQEALYLISNDQQSHSNEQTKEKNILHDFYLFSRIMKTISPNTQEPLFYSFNNRELDLTTRFITSRPTTQPQVALDNNYAATNMALSIYNQLQLTTLEDICKASVFAGTTFWNNHLDDPTFCLNDMHSKTQADLTIDSIKEFREKLTTAKKVLYIVDDSGEIVFDLKLIEQTLKEYPHLKIAIYCNSNQIKPNTHRSEIQYLLNQPDFAWLKQTPSLSIIDEANSLETIDMRFASQKLIDNITNADLVCIKGASYFENIPLLNKDRLYLFTVYQNTPAVLTGLEKGAGVFAFVPANTAAFEDIASDATPNRTLKDLF